MNRRAMAVRLSLLVALAGLLPTTAVGIISIDLLRRRSEHASQEALPAVAEQASGRIAGFLAHQRELLRTIAAGVNGPGAERRLAEVILEAPSLGQVVLMGPDTPPQERPTALGPVGFADALAGKETVSAVYLATDTTPAMDLCVPAPGLPGSAVCARLDLLELWRFVQHIRVGASGYALAFDGQGRLLASGAGVLRGAILTGEPVPESPFARAAARDALAAPTRYPGPAGQTVSAGWARLPDQGWAVVVEQPLEEALHSAHAAQAVLGLVLLLAVLLSVAIGVVQSQRVLGELAIEERWRTAGRIATGITHDLGHRLRVLQQTAALADSGKPAFAPQIRERPH